MGIYKTSENILKNKTVLELIEYCRYYSIPNYSNKKKAEIIETIKKHEKSKPYVKLNKNDITYLKKYHYINLEEPSPILIQKYHQLFKNKNIKMNQIKNSHFFDTKYGLEIISLGNNNYQMKYRNFRQLKHLIPLLKESDQQGD